MNSDQYKRWPEDLSEPVRYEYGPDSQPDEDVPAGVVEEHVWDASDVYPGTNRRYWVYIPHGYKLSEASGLMVVQDGGAWVDPEREMRTTIVMDNLIHRGEMPPAIGVFVDPGIFDAELPERLAWDPPPANRAVEYDSPTSAYADFLLTEILPAVRERHPITDDPSRTAIAGMSSGASCAFTAAWHRTDRFHRVLSCLGSYAQIDGGNPYPDLLGSSPPKPLRVCLQTDSQDINSTAVSRNWFSTNLRMAADLAESGYDMRLTVGDGGHNPNHPGAALPDMLRWLWR